MLFSECNKYVSPKHWRLECIASNDPPSGHDDSIIFQRENILLSIYSISSSLSTLFFKPSVQSLRETKKNRYRTPVFCGILLFNVVLQGLSSISVILLSANVPCWKECVWPFTVFYTADLCGLYLHQLVALESVLFLRNPVYTAGAFYLPRSIILTVIVYVLAFVCVDTDMFLDFFFCLPSIGILITTCIYTYKAPPPRRNGQVTQREPAYWVLIVAMVTLLVAYLPNLVTMCLVKLDNTQELVRLLEVNKITFSMRSLRISLDTILCLLVCKKILPVHCPL